MSTVVTEKGTKTVKSGEKFIVSDSFNPEELVELDQAGAVLVFDAKEGFVQLDDRVVAQLGKDNKQRYSFAKEFHDAWRGEEHAQFVEKFTVDKQLMGSASDRLNIKVDGRKFKIRWVRPDNVSKMQELGYSMVKKDEAKSFLDAKAGHYEISKLGQTELVAMKVPVSIFNERQKAKVKVNQEMAGSWRKSGKAEIDSVGGQGFLESEKNGQDWEERT
jgi:hypothetical protein